MKENANAKKAPARPGMGMLARKCMEKPMNPQDAQKLGLPDFGIEARKQNPQVQLGETGKKAGVPRADIPKSSGGRLP